MSRLVAAVASGETDEIEIVRAGHVVARLVPPRRPTPRRPGSWSGRVTIQKDFDDLPDEVMAAFRGESS